MPDTDSVLGSLAAVGAVALLVATFTVSALSENPLGWRLLAVFMLYSGVRRLRNGFQAPDEPDT